MKARCLVSLLLILTLGLVSCTPEHQDVSDESTDKPVDKPTDESTDKPTDEPKQPSTTENEAKQKYTGKPTVEHPKDEKNGTIIIRTFYTDDLTTKFVLYNGKEMSKYNLNRASESVIKSYSLITNYFKNPTYEWPNRISIHFLTYEQWPAKVLGFTYKKRIKLHSDNEGNYPIMHEMTHALLGYGDPEAGFDSKFGFFTQEGLATYLQDRYINEWHFYGMAIDKLEKYLLNHHYEISLEELTSKSSAEYFRSYSLKPMSLSYIEAASFVGFLIRRYGKKKFYRIYNQPNLQSKTKQVYDKSIKQLSEEWKHYIRTEVKLNEKDKMDGSFFLHNFSYDQPGDD